MLTPYHAGARVKGLGVDCAQVLYCVYHSLGLMPELPAKRDHRAISSLTKTPSISTRSCNLHDEIPESDVGIGDVILYKQPRFPVPHHGAIVIDWPDRVLHAIKDIGVTLSHGMNEGFLSSCERRCFSFIQ